jgi:hypothetical protein
VRSNLEVLLGSAVESCNCEAVLVIVSSGDTLISHTPNQIFVNCPREREYSISNVIILLKFLSHNFRTHFSIPVLGKISVIVAGGGQVLAS